MVVLNNIKADKRHAGKLDFDTLGGTLVGQSEYLVSTAVIQLAY